MSSDASNRKPDNHDHGEISYAIHGAREGLSEICLDEGKALVLTFLYIQHRT